MNIKRGYSMIEILVVLAISVIITGALFFSGGRMLQTYQFSQFMNELRLATSRMQSEAQTDLVERVILFHDKEYVLAKRVGSLEELIAKAAYPGNVKKISGNQVGFSMSGAPSVSGTITFKDSYGHEKKLIVAAVTGRIRIE